MSLRDVAAEFQPQKPMGLIDRLILDHPDRADEIRDLVIGEPLLSANVVARVIKREFGVEIGRSAISRWRADV